ncbi:addiction module protein [Devosia insulae DS-56]|uniref:Addiction module protein n=1 Tax=Devosia insulae DS-56 TaxID=1116389 RepID=A0A1E5XTT6_9HYPH|nr:type II toxin-antitoxin system RelE/ParE family toxin [Devosia insulae]OEO31976.1 addiction module protein [Devosia insulae DS-56]
MEIVEYTLADGRSPFGAWFEDLDAVAAAKVTVAISRLAQGNVSNVKGVGGGVLEQKINFGPGYRIYFGRDGDRLIILIGGGTKQRQHRDIAEALQRWSDYKTRKTGG